MATVQSPSFLDVRILLFINGIIQNFHLLAFLISSRHTGQAVFDLLQLIFNNLIPAQIWRGRLIGTSSDRAANMTGRLSGSVSRLSALTLLDYVRVWCMAQQLDLIVQKTAGVYGDELFYTEPTDNFSWLCRQFNFTSAIESKCPNLPGAQYLYLGLPCCFFLQHRVATEQHFAEKMPTNNPPT